MLDTTVLYDALVKLGRPPTPANPLDAAHRLASAYNDYATGALAGIVPMTTAGLELAALEACLLPVMAPLLGNAVTLAAAVASGITAYWTAGSLTAFVGGVTSPPPAAGALYTSLLPVFLAQSQPVETWAASLTALLDTCTRTVFVTFPGPTPVVSTLI